MVGAQLPQPLASPEAGFISTACGHLGAKCLALLAVSGNGTVATGAAEPIHQQTSLLGVLDPWLMPYTSLQRAKEGESHLTPYDICKATHQIVLNLGKDV